MAYSKEQKDKIFETVFNKVAGGMSVRKAIQEEKVGSATFFAWLEKDEEKQKQYARAAELRAEALLDEIYDIVDSTEADGYMDDDGKFKIDGNTVQRARLQADIRKWHISKLNPKKYGDRVDVNNTGEITHNIKPFDIRDIYKADDADNT